VCYDANITMDVKTFNNYLIRRPICKYYRFKMALWKLELKGCRYYTMYTLLIFINPRQVNYKMCIWDYLSFNSYKH
jgi:hypothetical protein